MRPLLGGGLASLDAQDAASSCLVSVCKGCVIAVPPAGPTDSACRCRSSRVAVLVRLCAMHGRNKRPGRPGATLACEGLLLRALPENASLNPESRLVLCY